MTAGPDETAGVASTDGRGSTAAGPAIVASGVFSGKVKALSGETLFANETGIDTLRKS
jgi:hypothetical protein